MKRKTFLIIVILILFFNMFLYVIPVNYKKIYKISNYKITEKYNKKDKMYSFFIKYKKDNFNVNIHNKYVAKKRLIRRINRIKIDNGYCLVFKTRKIRLYPVCKQDSKYISYHLVDNLKSKIDKEYYPTIKTTNQDYDSLTIKYLNNKKYLLWNYRYFYYINGNEKKKIELFNNDYYEIDLVTLVNNYLFVPDYDQGYSFNNAYVINMKNGELKKWEMKYDISTSSRILGTYNKSIFLLDEKNEELYEIAPHKMKIRKVSGRILENGKFKKYSIKKIINNKLEFKYNTYDNYAVIDDKLYLINDMKMLLSDRVTKVIYRSDDTVYYLVNDNLYMYNPLYGNVLLISNFEWSFHNNNMIFIY